MSGRAVLSVDLERFSDIPACRGVDLPGDASDPALGGLDWLETRLDEAGVRTTFFTVSAFAEIVPDRIDRLAAAGHDICSHTHTHPHLSEISPEERREELERSRAVLEDITGQRVSGFRAPSLDLAPDHFDLLAETGYQYDSSVIPSRSIPGWYGGQFETLQPCTARQLDPTAPSSITEVPLAVWPRLRLPLSGTWLRVFGIRYVLSGMRALRRRGVTPVVYVHPWELADLPRADGVASRVYWRTGPYVRRAIDRLLRSSFEFVPLAEVLPPTDGASRD